MNKTRPFDRLGLWQAWFLRDPAGFIADLPQPWRAMGLAELAAAAWATSALHAALRPAWRLAVVEQARVLVVAFDAEGQFLASAEASPGRPGLLRMRRASARIETHPYDGGEAPPVRLARWNGWTAYRAARRSGSPMTEALQAAWPPAGPRYMAGGARPFAPPTPKAYRAWIARNESAPTRIEWPAGPTFAIVVPSDDKDAAASVRSQIWPHWRLQSLDSPPVAGEVVLALRSGDRLAPGALARLGDAFQDPEVAVVYADEDRLDKRGRRFGPVFKTAFDAERLNTQDYIGGAVAARVGAVGGSVLHVPLVLWHRRTARDWPAAHAAAAPAAPPKVLAVIPTRDRPDLLRGCMAGLLDRTDHPGLEVCIVDNGSVNPETLWLLADLSERPGVQVLRVDGPFDYPALNNIAVKGAKARVLAFLNDDTLVIEPGWLTAMAALAVRPDVGAVGAKLFYPDGRIQHAGVSLGLGPLGVAGHGFRGAPGDLGGPQRMLKVTRQVSAVTGACLVVERKKFNAVKGFDSTFQAAFNDVDLCLRLAGHGWKSVWTPEARLVHLESASRGRDASPERTTRLQGEADRMHERWGELLGRDPYYHPALSLMDERFAMGEGLRRSAAR